MDGAFSVLVEKTGKVRRAAGDIGSVRWRLPEGLDGAPGQGSGKATIFSLFPAAHRDFVVSLLEAASSDSEGRVSDVTLLTAAGDPCRYHLTVQPSGPARWWFRFTPSDTPAGASSDDGAGPSPTVIWVDYFDSVSYLIDTSADRPIELMLLSFEALESEALAERVGADAMGDVRAAIETTLADHAVDGRVGRLDAGSYAVACDAGIDADAIIDTVGAATRTYGVDVDDLGARAQTVALDAGGAGPEQVKAALSHVRRSFLDDDDDEDEGGVGAGAAPPSKSLNAVLDGIEIDKARITRALDAGDIALSCYPVIALTSGAVALNLAHGRLLIDGVPVRASRRLIMGDYPGLALHHDLTMARRALDEIARARDEGPPAGAPPPTTPIIPMIIDVNATSLAAPEFTTRLAELLAEYRIGAPAIGFRTLSLDMAKQSAPAYRTVVRLLDLGHPVWLIRFGAAITDATLEGAYVEVAADYLQRLCGAADGRDLVTQLLEIWREAQVRLVAVDVRDAGQVRFVRDLGIEYALGPAVARGAQGGLEDGSA